MPPLLDSYLKDNLALRKLFIWNYLFFYERFGRGYFSMHVGGNDAHIAGRLWIVNRNLGITKLDKTEHEKLRLAVAGKNAFFYSRGIPYYLFLAPDKSTLYPEILPFWSKYIKYAGIYGDIVKSLSMTHVNYYSMLDYLFQHRFDDGKLLFDRAYDIDHWNGNAVKFAVRFIADSIVADNPKFKKLLTTENFEKFDEVVDVLIYGKELTQFVRIKNMHDICCTRTARRIVDLRYATNFCVNQKAASGALLFLSDSYFAATHGAQALTPFVQQVHYYLHGHIENATVDRLEKSLSLLHSDIVIEEFVERASGWQISAAGHDPKLRILGDVWMKTGGILIDPYIEIMPHNTSRIIVKHAPEKITYTPIRFVNSREKPKSAELILNSEQTADDLGRVVFMGNVNIPQKAQIIVKYTARSEGKGLKRGTLKIDLKPGDNLVHETVWVEPYSKVSMKAELKTPCTYAFKNIPEVDDLRRRMAENGL